MTAAGFLRTFDGMLPMQLGVTKETELFLLACLVGAALGAGYQLLRAFRVIVPHFKWAVFFEDALFGLFAGGCVFLLCADMQQKLRLFVLLGAGVSAAVTGLMLGRPFIAVITAVDGFIKKKMVKPAFVFIAKSAKRCSGKNVQNYKNLNFFKKSEENRLKEPISLVYNKKSE